jgi:hypothetical protein
VYSKTVKEYQILSVKPGAVTIDGTLDEGAWQNAKFTDDFVILATGAKPVLRTRAKILWDADNLYFAFDAEDTDIYAKETVQDAGFYNRDDLVEVYADPDGDGKNYLELGVSAKGTTYDYIIIKPSETDWQDNQVWDIKSCSVKSVVHGTLNSANDKDTGWTAEIKIPFASLDYANFGISLPVKAGDIWRGNLCRYDYDCSSNIDDFNEETSWVMIGASALGPHIPGKFGKFVFSSQQVGIQKKSPLSAVADKRLRICIRGVSEQTVLFQVDQPVRDNAEISIYSMEGREIAAIPLYKQRSAAWSVKQVPAGLYICRLINGKDVDAQSFIVER